MSLLWRTLQLSPCVVSSVRGQRRPHAQRTGLWIHTSLVRSLLSRADSVFFLSHHFFFFWLFHDSVFPDYGNVDRILSIAPTRHQILMLLVPHPLWINFHKLNPQVYKYRKPHCFLPSFCPRDLSLLTRKIMHYVGSNIKFVCNTWSSASPPFTLDPTEVFYYI